MQEQNTPQDTRIAAIEAMIVSFLRDAAQAVTPADISIAAGGALEDQQLAR